MNSTSPYRCPGERPGLPDRSSRWGWLRWGHRLACIVGLHDFDWLLVRPDGVWRRGDPDGEFVDEDVFGHADACGCIDIARDLGYLGPSVLAGFFFRPIKPVIIRGCRWCSACECCRKPLVTA